MYCSVHLVTGLVLQVDIADFGGNGLGLKVIDNIDEAEKVLQIPESLMLSWSEVMKSSLASFVKSDPLLRAMPNLALAVALLNERYNPNSFWRPYISKCMRTCLSYLNMFCLF